MRLQSTRRRPCHFNGLPPNFLAHAPELRRLTLRDMDPEVLDWEVPTGRTELPPDLLVHVPKLRGLTLDLPRLAALPVDFQTAPNLYEVRDPGGCAVSETDPADRPSLLARFLDACGMREPVMRRRGATRVPHPGLPEPPGGRQCRGPEHGVGVFRWGLPAPVVVKHPTVATDGVPHANPGLAAGGATLEPRTRDRPSTVAPFGIERLPPFPDRVTIILVPISSADLESRHC